MNDLVIIQTTQGLAKYLLSETNLPTSVSNLKNGIRCLCYFFINIYLNKDFLLDEDNHIFRSRIWAL